MRKIFALAAALLVFAGCSHHKEIQLESMDVVSFTPHGFKSADAVIALSIDNPRSTFRVIGAEATVFRNGQEFGTVMCPDYIKVAHGLSTVEVLLHGRITGNISAMDLLFLLNSKDFSQFSVNYTVTAKDFLGFKHVISGEDLPIHDFVSQLDL